MVTNDKTFDEIATAKKRIKKTTANLSIPQMFEGELMRCLFFRHILTGKELPSRKVDKYNQPKTFVALYYPLLFCGKGYKVIDPHGLWLLLIRKVITSFQTSKRK